MNNVIIIAGGWSANRHEMLIQDIAKRIFSIGVNEASVIAGTTCAITMDRLWLENRYEQLNTLNIPVYYRQGIRKKEYPLPLGVPFKNNNENTEMSRAPDTLNGNNSGACALNLAYRRGFENVYLFGMDMQRGPNGESHWYPGYPWNKNGGTPHRKLQKWAGEFDYFAQQFSQAGQRVVNVGGFHSMTAFPSIPFKQFLQETK